ncbi:hypothetical protein MLD38_029365 [Melastoma candidum]|uniref:Uncharacterized protein n=1 Tax=Melastoma candidum TaxID=119954 RepID=A0ACB9N3J8_9MYRT|nr:hypothetical protein MLD38_029365 [Melastoma candidum]
MEAFSRCAAASSLMPDPPLPLPSFPRLRRLLPTTALAARSRPSQDSLNLCSLRACAVSPRLPGDACGDVSNNAPSPSCPSSQVEFMKPHEPFQRNGEKTLTTEAPLSILYGGGTRASLFRTPISGGVLNATSAHGLPRPTLAVRNLMEQARFAHLCTVTCSMHHGRGGYPFGSLVDFAPDPTGHPIFSFSPLEIHSRNLLADPRCTLVVQIPGWSGLSSARVTIFGDVYPLPESQQGWAHKLYKGKHHQGPSQQWGNFHYFRMQNISDIYFIGGFGTVAWVDVKEYESILPDKIAVDGCEQTLKELNVIFSQPLKELLSMEGEVDDAALISIDSKGTDIRVRQGAQFSIQRTSFEEGNPVETLEQAKAALCKLIDKGVVHNMQL